MEKRKNAKLDSKTLYEMGDVMHVQQAQLFSLEKEKDGIKEGLACVKETNNKTEMLADEADKLTDELLSKINENNFSIASDLLDSIEKDELNGNKEKKTEIKVNKTETIRTYNDWEKYLDSINSYATKNHIDTTIDPFSVLLSQREYEKLNEEINDEFAKRTSIKNKTDLIFLAVATALQVAKSLLFSVVADKYGYGDGADSNERLDHNDSSIKQQERSAKDSARDKLGKGKKNGEWIEILNRTPPYDTLNGSHMSGKNHRLKTLGHDPILGWIFGTMNILTDTVTFNTFKTYEVERIPKMWIRSDRPVSIFELTSRSVKKTQEDFLNLPAAIIAEKIHLKSDAFTKCGLPVPILSTVAPEFAGRLYQKQYDVLCMVRDIRIVGVSAVISVIIDIIINLVHSLFYNKDKDGTKDMYEVRTRKILLISNVIASTSNIIYSAITQNPKSLDIGGLFVTVTHLFTDARFILNVKKEFIENRIYEKIEDEIEAIDNNINKIFEYEYFSNIF